MNRNINPRLSETYRTFTTVNPEFTIVRAIFSREEGRRERDEIIQTVGKSFRPQRRQNLTLRAVFRERRGGTPLPYRTGEL